MNLNYLEPHIKNYNQIFFAHFLEDLKCLQNAYSCKKIVENFT